MVYQKMVRVTVYVKTQNEFQVVMRLKESGVICKSKQLFGLCAVLNPGSVYKFCPGIDPNIYETRYLSIIRYDIKVVRKISDPIVGVQSRNCSLWHKLARNASIFEKDISAVLCPPSKRLRSDLEQRLKTSSVIPVPLQYLSPDSTKKKKNAQIRCKSMSTLM